MTVDVNAAFKWQCQPEAENFIIEIVEKACQQNPFIEHLKQQLLTQTSTRLFDWIDHVMIGYDAEHEKRLLNSGFVADHAMPTYRIFHHPGAQLPRIVLQDDGRPVGGLALSVESIADFLMVRGMSAKIEGSPWSGYRRCCVSSENDVSLWVIERRGTQTCEPTYPNLGYLEKYFLCLETWKSRPRSLFDEDEAMKQTLKIAAKIVEELGEDLAASLVLGCERDYWQSRNTAAQVQKNRQDRLGMGWANHDHHTFRSSRKQFVHLVRLFEMLGFYCRERYYTGKEAGWGAQIMENPRARLVLFLDVDLTPDEVTIDFAHHPLSETDHLGTIGLWCALHGDSILNAGMHHLEAQFFFEELKKDLASTGIGMMEPFSFFPYLKQAFTKGEQWDVDHKRIDGIFAKKLITDEQAEKFRKTGAVGSHLENLQRREGYKGFNQKNVSIIIQKTDARTIGQSLDG